MKRAVAPIAYENDGCGTLTLKNAQELEAMLRDIERDRLRRGRS